MGTTFFETMSGELFDGEGVAHHVAFDVRATSRRPPWRLAESRTALSGTIRARPWADGAACHGTLELSPLRGKRLVYELWFQGEDGARYHLYGRKDLSLARPWASMTTLATELHREGARLAEGTLTFKADDLPSFLASFRPITALRTLDLGAGSSLGLPGPLPEREIELLAALGETLVAPGDIVPAYDARSTESAVTMLSHLPPHLRELFRAGLRGLDHAAVARFGRRFSALSPESRLRLLDGLDALGASGALHALSLPITTAHFSRRDYLDAVGYPELPPPRPEPDPPWMANHTPVEALDDDQLEVDVAVIGTGAGGGPVATALAERGLAVALIEEGRYYQRHDFSGPPEDRLRRFWRDCGMQMALGASPVPIPTGRLVGGSTAINSGTCYRTPDEVLSSWRIQGFPDDFRPDRFGRWLDAVEDELQVTEADRRYLGKVAEAVARGAEAVGARHGPLRRNAPGCDGQGLCPYGCPTDAKRSSNVSWVPRALKAGAALFTGLRVDQLLMRDRRCVGLEATGQDSHGATRRLTVRAKAVVVAAGTLESPLLLARSGIRLPWLGRNLSVHPALGVFARFDEDLGQPWLAIPQSTFVDGLVDPRLRFEGFNAPPGLAPSGLSLRGPALTRWMDAIRDVGQFGFMARDAGVGRVRPGPGGRPLITYPMAPEVVDLLKRGYAALAELLLRGGAREVASAVDTVGVVRSLDQARAIAKAPIEARHIHAMGFHPLGTCRPGASVEEGVVDFDHRVHGAEGLYVVDGSTVPTSLGVNPQVTIMAMALRAAERLADRLESESNLQS